MTGSDRSFRTLLSHAAEWIHGLSWNTRAGSEHEEEEPLRAALFSSDQMVAHGKLLAGRHRLAQRHRPDRLLARLAANQRVLEIVARQLRQAVADDRPVTPAAEWLLDNMYLIDEEVRTARRHLPHGYSRELPRLADADPAVDGTMPRVYDLALEAIAHADGRLSRGSLSRFVAAYQAGQPLKLGELWAFPIMLRLALIENLRRVAVRVAAALDERDMAETWASRMLQAAEERPSDLILVIADMARSNPNMSSAFVAEFARRLQGQGAALALPLTWMEQRLSDESETIERLVAVEGQKQAASQVSVANSIGSLRLLGATHWPEFVETLSSVEQVLRQDPLGVYGRMDFDTRDIYRHAVEKVAKASSGDEPAVAAKAIELAAAAAARGIDRTPGADGDAREAHVGYWLIGNGRPALETAMNARRRGLLRRDGHSPLPAYVGGILAFAMLMSLGPMQQAARELGLQPWSPQGIGLVLLLMLGTSQLALALVNWIVTLSVTPEALPRMDYAMGIDPRARTLVAVPTLLGKHADVDTLVDALEV
ncbi:MAG TPA: cyclic beta 1-2 glucan synthetase, partial [Burkholderiaceae bacterium]